MKINKLELLEKWAYDNSIKKEDIVLVGSAVLAANNIRENNDLEFILSPNAKKVFDKHILKKIRYWGHVEVAENIDLFYNFAAVVGKSDKDIFKERRYSDVDGWNVLSMDIEYSYKYFLLRYLGGREKDKNDIQLMETSKKIVRDKINWLMYLYVCIKRRREVLYYLSKAIFSKLMGVNENEKNN